MEGERDGLAKLSDAVYAEMDRRRMNVREFAEHVGISHATVSNIRNRRREHFSTETLRKLAPVLHVELDTIFEWTGHRPAVEESVEDEIARTLARLESFVTTPQLARLMVDLAATIQRWNVREAERDAETDAERAASLRTPGAGGRTPPPADERDPASGMG